ncbi:ribbon-helix-helix domain-containing protein [Halodurantibacterium flavum]|uniref:Ribbon-helix-helix domain-containing protein n=1 Tax=Halodurantibacterium flavum TaxID=1382802 RepID=A0ABW4SAC1_9RHOB
MPRTRSSRWRRGRWMNTAMPPSWPPTSSRARRDAFRKPHPERIGNLLLVLGRGQWHHSAAGCCKSPRRDSMGKSGRDSVRVTTTLTREQHAELERIAKQNGVTVAWLVRRAAERLIEQASGPLFSLDLGRGDEHA